MNGKDVTSTKWREERHDLARGKMNLTLFILYVLMWQKKNPPLEATDSDRKTLQFLAGGELEEVDEHLQIRYSKEHSFSAEAAELVDAGVFFSCLDRYMNDLGGEIDRKDVVAAASMQSAGSSAIEKMMEVVGNISEKSLQSDLKYLWILWVSYSINMKELFSPLEVLLNEVLPKNNGNYPNEVLAGNPPFEKEFGRKMNHDELLAYYEHFRRAFKMIRTFAKTKDPEVEYKGLSRKHYRPYLIYIYSFTHMPGIGFSNSEQALMALERQLNLDYTGQASADEIVVADMDQIKQYTGRYS